ncbi:MAG TPA: ComEC/Rec2 family competence protein, partial [Solirubrobacterales bacterium]|nr:ComEC/Rec2 family competence protein [Solirubrobacterales bacterium]
MSEITGAWRLMGLSGLVLGLGLAPFLTRPEIAAAPPGAEIALALVCACALAAIRPRTDPARVAWLASVAVTAAAAGLILGEDRLRSIDAGALHTAPPHAANTGDPDVASGAVSLGGELVAYPRRSPDLTRFKLQTPRGLVMVESRAPPPDLSPGDRLRATGTLAEPPDWYAAQLRREGIARILTAERVTVEPGPGRGGLTGLLDGIRDRAELGIAAGMPPREAALARGFVLGQDDGIDPVTREDFRRSGLAHLLAVSGQNVMLLVILASLPLAIAGVSLRARIPVLIGLVAIYVPLAGAGPSIQRAGAMGAAGLLALAAGRPTTRSFGLLIAAAFTLALNPRASGDVGWQLSFAAVIGILVLAPGFRGAIRARLGRGPWQQPLAEGTAITLAATIATAPLLAYHFETFPIGTVCANLLALPAVAPAMWLGMAAGALGQIPLIPTELPNQLNAVFLSYIAEVAAMIGRPGWAEIELPMGSPWAVALAEITLFGLTLLGLRIDRTRRRRLADGGQAGERYAADPNAPGPDARGRRARGPRARRRVRARVGAVVAVLVLAAPLLVAVGGEHLPGARPGEPAGLRLTALDIGQGDAILLQVGTTGSLLVDTGPPGAGLVGKLGHYGVERLDAVIITHADADHAGALAELLSAIEVERLLQAAPLGEPVGAITAAAGLSTVTVAAGNRLRLGPLQLEVLWPEPEAVEVEVEAAESAAAAIGADAGG